MELQILLNKHRGCFVYVELSCDINPLYATIILEDDAPEINAANWSGTDPCRFYIEVDSDEFCRWDQLMHLNKGLAHIEKGIAGGNTYVKKASKENS